MGFTPLAGTRAPVRVWTDPYAIEPQAARQLRNIGALPWIQGVAVMPDVHYGKGATVGSVIAMRQAVSPGRGRRRHRLRDVGGQDLADRRRPAGRPGRGCAPRSRQAIPVGFAHARRRRRPAADPRPGAAGWDDFWGRFDGLDRRVAQLGDAGAAADRHARRRQPLHRGLPGAGRRRRGPGLADAALRVPQHRQGAGRAAHRRWPGSCRTTRTCPTATWPCSSPARRRWTRTARSVLGAGVRAAQPRGHAGAALRRGAGAFPQVGYDEPISCHHNYVAEESYDGVDLLVTRKGAIRAGRGDLGIIPGLDGHRVVHRAGPGQRRTPSARRRTARAGG